MNAPPGDWTARELNEHNRRSNGALVLLALGVASLYYLTTYHLHGDHTKNKPNEPPAIELPLP